MPSGAKNTQCTGWKPQSAPVTKLGFERQHCSYGLPGKGELCLEVTADKRRVEQCCWQQIGAFFACKLDHMRTDPENDLVESPRAGALEHTVRRGNTERLVRSHMEAVRGQRQIDEIHARRADEECGEAVRRIIEQEQSAIQPALSGRPFINTTRSASDMASRWS